MDNSICAQSPRVCYNYSVMLGKHLSAIRKVGNSCAIIVPIDLLRAHNMRRGDEVILFSLPDGTLAVRLVPEGAKDKIIAY